MGFRALGLGIQGLGRNDLIRHVYLQGVWGVGLCGLHDMSSSYARAFAIRANVAAANLRMEVSICDILLLMPASTP